MRRPKKQEASGSPERVLSIDEFRHRLGGDRKPIAAKTIHGWLSSGRFGLERVKVGRRTMLKESDLKKVLGE